MKECATQPTMMKAIMVQKGKLSHVEAIVQKFQDTLGKQDIVDLANINR
jgi:hypothetical protein